MDKSSGTETGSPREVTLRVLFGGAMECLLPATFVDVRWGRSTCQRASGSSSECAAVLPNAELFVSGSASARLGLVHNSEEQQDLLNLSAFGKKKIVYKRDTRVDNKER